MSSISSFLTWSIDDESNDTDTAVYVMIDDFILPIIMSGRISLYGY